MLTTMNHDEELPRTTDADGSQLPGWWLSTLLDINQLPCMNTGGINESGGSTFGS